MTKTQERASEKNQYVIILVLYVFSAITYCLAGCSSIEVKSLDLKSVYVIEARLNPDIRVLDYTVQVMIRNGGEGSAKELYFHLYGNRYKTENEGIEVISVTNENGSPIPYEIKDNDQLILLTLINALDSGEEISILFICKATLPMLESIYGIARDGEIQMPFFYPKLAMYDNNGWNTKPLAQHGDGRYQAMSDYTMTIQVPSEYEVVCNGVESSKETQNGYTTYVFQAYQRRELVFTAFTNFVHMERSVGATRILGYFNDKHNLSVMEYAMDAVVFSMEYYNRIYIEYPFDTLVITNAAWGRSPVSMEYSGIFTLAQMSGVEGEIAIYHEMAHQWFYFLVGNNECAEPWLDEGFATFSAQLCLDAAGHEESYETWWEIYEFASALTGGAVNVGYDETDVPSNLFYFRGAVFLKELMDVVGKDEFLSILTEYCERYAFGFATTQDFINLLRERAPNDVDSIIDEYVR
jgi:hypothetical protein